MNKVTVGAIALGLVVTGCTTAPVVATVATEATQDQAVPVYQKSASAVFDECDTRIRAEFDEQLGRVKDGQSKEQVIEILGEPDVVEIDEERGYELWLYGCPNKDALPVLGRVHFEEGVVAGQRFWSPNPSTSPDLPEENVLREILRFMHETAPTRRSGDDPLHKVRVANRLIPLGKKQVIATINELSDLGFDTSHWLILLTQILFEVPDDPGYIYSGVPAGDQQLRQGTRVPRFPTILIDDVPVTIYTAMGIRGAIPRVSRYLKVIGKEEMRKKLFKPADDPFESLENLWSSQKWPFPYEPGEDDLPLKRTEHEYKGDVLWDVLRLVRTVYRPSWLPDSFRDEDDVMRYFERYHSEFLAIGAVWNVEKQMYALKDGSVPYPLQGRNKNSATISGSAKVKSAETALSSLGNVLEMFRLDMGRYPTTEEGLFVLWEKPDDSKNWRGPYTLNEIPLDPWENEYYYEYLGGEDGYILMSFGADGDEGGEGFDADIIATGG